MIPGRHKEFLWIEAQTYGVNASITILSHPGQKAVVLKSRFPHAVVGFFHFPSCSLIVCGAVTSLLASNYRFVIFRVPQPGSLTALARASPDVLVSTLFCCVIG